MGKLLFAFGPFHLDLNENDAGDQICVLRRTDRQRDGRRWPHLTIFPKSKLHGGLDIHLTWEDHPQHRVFLAKMSHHDLEEMLKPFAKMLQEDAVAEVRRARLPDLARAGYVAMYVADDERMREYLLSIVPLGPKKRRTVDLSRFQQIDKVYEGMSFADPRELPALLNAEVIPAKMPIMCFREGDGFEDGITVFPFKTAKGWTWAARPLATIGGVPIMELFMRTFLKCLPESFAPGVLRVIDEMGMRDFDIDTSKFEDDWTKARALVA